MSGQFYLYYNIAYIVIFNFLNLSLIESQNDLYCYFKALY